MKKREGRLFKPFILERGAIIFFPLGNMQVIEYPLPSN